MNRNHLATLVIAEQAAEWFEKLPTATARENKAFLEWFRQSPVHALEFFLAVRTAERLKHLDSQRLMNVQALIARAASDAARLETPLPSQLVRPGSPENDRDGQLRREISQGR